MTESQPYKVVEFKRTRSEVITDDGDGSIWTEEIVTRTQRFTPAGDRRVSYFGFNQSRQMDYVWHGAEEKQLDLGVVIRASAFIDKITKLVNNTLPEGRTGQSGSKKD